MTPGSSQASAAVLVSMLCVACLLLLDLLLPETSSNAGGGDHQSSRAGSGESFARLLSPSATSYAPTRWAVLTSTADAPRLHLVAVCAFHWATVLEYRPYIVLVGKPSRLARAEAALRPFVEALGGRLYVLSLEWAPSASGRGGRAHSAPFLSMAMRLFAAALPGIEPDDEIVSTGADRLPLQPRAFHVAPRRGASFVRISHWRPGVQRGRHLAPNVTYDEGNCTHARWCRRGFHFDICYLRARARVWRAATFGDRPLGWKTMQEELERFGAWAQSGREMWFGDQLLLTELLTEWDAPHRPSQIDTLYVDELAARRGWWHGKFAYDAARHRLSAAAEAQISRGRAFELHKLNFVPREPPYSPANWAATQQVLRAAARAAKRPIDLAPLERLVKSRWWEAYLAKS